MEASANRLCLLATFRKCSRADVAVSFIQSSVSQTFVPHPILACEQLSRDTITCYQLTCSSVECSKQLFLQHYTTFPVFSLAPVQTCFKHVAGIS